MVFFQDPPQLGNQYDADPLLREYLERSLPADALASIEDDLRSLGELAGTRLFELPLQDRLHEPRHTPWDAWGRRIDAIEVTSVWREAARLAAERGLVALAYER